MSEISDEMLEAGARAINGSYCAGQTLCPDKHSQLCGCRRIAHAVLSAVLPMAVEREREACAQIAQGFSRFRHISDSSYMDTGDLIATAIRSRNQERDT